MNFPVFTTAHLLFVPFYDVGKRAAVFKVLLAFLRISLNTNNLKSVDSIHFK
ncbi:MAG: hypothetical protein QRY74_05155 [Chlamydia sp.]